MGLSDISPTVSVIYDGCQSEIYMFLLGTQQQQRIAKLKLHFVIKQEETCEVVQHKLACLFYGLLLEGTTGFLMPLVDQGQLTAHNNCGQNEETELGRTLLEEGHF